MEVAYVDEDDQVIGSGTDENALKTGTRVRIARVFLFNSQGELLLQKRSRQMLTSPGKWDQSAAGHVDVGEDYAQAAARELKEEMGVSSVKLKKLTKYYVEDTKNGFIKRRFNTIFTGTYDGEVQIDKKEVDDFAWMALDTLEADIAKNPDIYAGGFVDALKKYSPSPN